MAAADRVRRDGSRRAGLGDRPARAPPAGIRHHRAGCPRRHRTDRPPPGGVMTPPHSPAGHEGRILARADETDVDILSQAIPEPFSALPPSRSLVALPASRPP